MIFGIGTDIIEISRIGAKLNNQKFLDKVYTKKEQEYILHKGAQSASGIFCCKEAVLKALKKGIVDMPLTDIEVLHEASGAPFCNVVGFDGSVYLSISHCKEYAVAIAVLEK